MGRDMPTLLYNCRHLSHPITNARIRSGASLGIACLQEIGDLVQLAPSLVPKSTGRTAAVARAINA
jgi:hypothetical protein